MHPLNSESMNQWAQKVMNHWVNEPINRWTNEPMNQMNQWINEPMNPWINAVFPPHGRVRWIPRWRSGWSTRGCMGYLCSFACQMACSSWGPGCLAKHQAGASCEARRKTYAQGTLRWQHRILGLFPFSLSCGERWLAPEHRAPPLATGSSP